MPCSAEFGIIDKLDRQKDYSSEYTPKKYHCVAIDDEFLDGWWPQLEKLRTYFHSYDRPEFALARYGVTLIPPESVRGLYRIVATDRRSRSNKELKALLVLLERAMIEEKYVIHYGV